MKKQSIGWNPGAPYSKAVKANGFLYVSGNVSQGDGIQAQTRQVLEQLKKIVEDAGSSLEDAVRCTVYLTNMGDFAAMNEVYKQYFPSEPPTRTTIGVTGLARPEFIVEIDLIAAL